MKQKLISVHHKKIISNFQQLMFTPYLLKLIKVLSFLGQTTQIQIHIPRTARMLSILHCCWASPLVGKTVWDLGELTVSKPGSSTENEERASDALVILGGEVLYSGVLIDWLPIIINCLQSIPPTQNQPIKAGRRNLLTAIISKQQWSN